MMSARSGHPVHAVVLAAGNSSRLGHPKQRVEIDGQTLLRRAVTVALASRVTGVTVVVGAEHEALSADLAGFSARIVHNPEWPTGMASSIRCGVHAVSAPSAILFLLCDQLRLTTAHLDAMIAGFDRGATIVASGYAGTIGVPALFSSAFRDELLALRGAHGAKRLLEQHAASVQVVPLLGGELDVDTPDDLP